MKGSDLDDTCEISVHESILKDVRLVFTNDVTTSSLPVSHSCMSPSYWMTVTFKYKHLHANVYIKVLNHYVYSGECIPSFFLFFAEPEKIQEWRRTA